MMHFCLVQHSEPFPAMVALFLVAVVVVLYFLHDFPL